MFGARANPSIAQPVVKCLGETGTENVWAPAQPVVKCLGVTGNVWRDGKCLARAPTRQDSQPVDSPTRQNSQLSEFQAL